MPSLYEGIAIIRSRRGSISQAQDSPGHRAVGGGAAGCRPRLHIVQRLERGEAAIAAAQRRTRQQTYELTGKVVPGSISHPGEQLDFRIADRDGPQPIPVTYTGTVPDPFRDGREVIVTGKCRTAPSSASGTAWSRSARRSSPTTTPGQSELTILGSALLAVALLARALRGRALRSTARARATGAGSTPRAGRSTRWRRC